ncbi:Dyp-type peroxidase [Brachybacterium sp. AOP25-B2-12]|uniref:Dyp-type peroxidase n=1 Tax=Brachybacterium sp. AOP25-B2-12 TaxID=3457710 RepID=UPI004033F919
MPTQQVIAPPARAAMFLTLTVPPGSERAVRAVLAGASDLAKSVAFRNPRTDLVVTIGLGAEYWDRCIDLPRPRDLHPLPEFRGPVHTAPSTPGDVLVHLRAPHMDMCFEYAWLLTQQLGAHATVVDEVHGFSYYDERDLLGFVDGTANPIGDDAAASALVQPDRDAQYAGSSYVVVQKYLHDMEAWQSLSVEAQERVIGRYKLNDVEIPDALKATDSHVAMTTIVDEQGVEHDILRDNLPFGEIGSAEFGTYFIGYAGNPLVTEQMLHNMFIGRPEGTHDRILDFSTPVTGALFFVPTLGFLDGIDDLALPAPAAAEPGPGEIPAVPQHAEGAEVLGAPDRTGADDATTPDVALGLDPTPTDPTAGTSDDTSGAATAPAADDTPHDLGIGSLRSPSRSARKDTPTS